MGNATAMEHITGKMAEKYIGHFIMINQLMEQKRIQANGKVTNILVILKIGENLVMVFIILEMVTNMKVIGKIINMMV